MQVLIVRHAPAANSTEWSRKGKADELRPLTGEGRDRMRRIARGLARLTTRLDVVISSPLRRSVETAAVLQECFPFAKREKLDALRPGGDPEGVLARLATLDAQATAALVGHEPDLGALLARLLTGEADAFVDLKKGAVALVEFEAAARAGRGLLRWLLQPAHLRRLGR
ncbi:MAG: phosphohistidine phosphatase SixA [Planctomycetes bacterium]|nr:phosphohistidine phosphatase SixA [Planctomycetota bacterium]